ncbi:MAG TPA: VIT1/CCC1 transporter family protein [Acidimicrobiales bacterium]|nr:VIT1/CCC1 transporter family protein [Acidimicrobiales bacterium]
MPASAHRRATTRHLERHRSGRVGWLRAAVLGADDGIVSTASLMLGVAASSASRSAILTAGVAGLAAGAMAMAAGEYVSVASQRDAEHADLARERAELAAGPDAELTELTDLYVERGVEPELAARVARQLTDHDALAAHARDELGLAGTTAARPLQAAGASAVAFAAGATLSVVALLLAPAAERSLAIVAVALLALAVLGALGGLAGGAGWRKGALRVVAGGGLAMALTTLVGHLAHAAGI